MNLLLDTHAVIWFITEDEQLPRKSKLLIEDKGNACFVSIASLWEMGIKHSLGKLDLKEDIQIIFDLIDQSELILLPITTTHILTSTFLPFQHRDPFDRLLIAQAKTEGLTIIIKDNAFKHYEASLIW